MKYLFEFIFYNISQKRWVLDESKNKMMIYLKNSCKQKN